MRSEGHEIKVLTTPKNISIELLEHYDIPYQSYSHPTNASKANSQLKLHYETWKLAVEFQPDFLTGIGGTSISHVSTLVDGKSIIFTDTEDAILQNKLTFPFADNVYTPECYKEDIGSNQVRYPGYHELAYLHPDRFEPDPSVLDYIDADEKDKIVIVRLSSWDAAHDIQNEGFGDIISAVSQLESTGAKVVFTSEKKYPNEIEHCISQVPIHKIHDLMYYSNLYIGEGVTMASESAVLGTPSIFISTRKLGYLDELEDRYGLVFNFHGEDRQKKGLNKAVNILNNYDGKKWKNRRKKMLEDKIDVTNLMLHIFS